MNPKMWPRWAQESCLGETSALDEAKMWPRWAQETFFGEISSLKIFQDEAQDVAKVGSRKLPWRNL